MNKNNEDQIRNQNSTNIAVMGKQIENIEKNINEIKLDIKDLVKKVSDTFATKKELYEVKKDVLGIQGIFTWAGRIIIGVVIIALLSLIFVK